MANPNWVVNDIQVRDNYTLRLWFEDGSVKDFDCTELLNEPIYTPLRDINFFQKAQALYGTVRWNEDIDIAPEYLYEHGKNILDINPANVITEEEMSKRLNITQEDLDSIGDVEIE